MVEHEGSKGLKNDLWTDPKTIKVRGKASRKKLFINLKKLTSQTSYAYKIRRKRKKSKFGFKDRVREQIRVSYILSHV